MIKHQKFIRGLCVLTLVVGVLGVVIGSTKFPEIAATAGGGSDLGGSCGINSGKVVYWDSCYGATWRYYSVGQASSTFAGGVATATPEVLGTDQAPGGVIRGCENVGGYYILGLEVYNPQNQGSYGYQRGIIQANDLTINGGYINFRVVNGSDPWETVHNKFALAEAAGATNGYTWDSNLGWFCYSPDFETRPSEGSFKSHSGVEVTHDANKQASDITDHKVVSDNDGTVTLKISTNSPQVNVDFFHTIEYDGGIANNGSTNDVYDNVSTNWTTQWSKGASSQVGTGTFNTNGTTANSGSEAARTSNQTINIEKGQTVTYCQKISYDPKKVNMLGKPVTDNGRVLYFHYEVTGSSSGGSSEACIEITRPNIPGDKDPDPDPNPDPNDAGPKFDINPGLGVFYAGENSNASWAAKVEGVPTRRYAGYQAINYLVNSGAPYSAGMMANNTAYRGSDICNYFTSNGFARSCRSIDSGSRSTDNPADKSVKIQETYGSSSASNIGNSAYRQRRNVSVIVPDYVGDKYCSTLGYRFEYWVGVEKNGTTEWTHESSKDYWAIYGSVCRTIAKKPSVAIWNGSIITSEGVGIAAISSSRHDSAVSNQPGQIAGSGEGETNDGDLKKFGSWTEHLAAIGGAAQDFASGSALALGNTNCLNDISIGCSNLTISNDNSNTRLLGFSGIQRNSSYQTRLQTFLKDKAQSGSNVDQDFGTNMTGTHIFKYSGKQTITHNIIYDEGRTYDSVYQLPQNIIFVDGDLDISSNVTRIDAWLIVSGKINTCAEFGRGTAADSASSRQTTCTAQLAINGPVVANRGLALNRSYGSDPIVNSISSFGTSSNRNSPAEIFNLRQDSYLWAYAQAGRYDSSYTEAYSRELAPRY